MHRGDPMVDDLVYAIIIGTGGKDASRGFVRKIEGDKVYLIGPSWSAICEKSEVLVIPRDQYTAAEEGLLNWFLEFCDT